ncbi:DUF1127 domain-containing protein [Methyloversatilis thermotolerans]|uniref:DUF1127 domain-containing protein n=1 Tax=Methyloversatilis thermotolerans TaxID=1346290 RepID=UPI000982095C|nr:DUF1127 domain-containing protein [Methyloversatilis thermotolerans]
MPANAWLRDLYRRIALARRRARADAELRGMNDLELRDLGLGRSDIPSVIGDRFGGHPFRPQPGRRA